MSITTKAIKRSKTGWGVFALTSDASGCETLKAAPGSGKNLLLEKFSAIGSANSFTIGIGEAASAVETTVFPGAFTTECPTVTYAFSDPVLLTTNSALSIDASAAGTIALYIEGDTIGE